MISAIIPARNEQFQIARAVESVAAQPEVREVIVVNDESTDETATVLAELKTRISKLKVFDAGELPVGWVGKNHAASVGAAAASGEWLLFTDADTYHYPGSARRALNDAVDHDAVMVSYSPEQETRTFWERSLVPFVYCRLATRYPYSRINDPKSPDAAANGQYLMILRDVYKTVGGHAAVAGEVLEDVALAQRVKKAGYRIYFTVPFGTVRTRMYTSFGDMWQGWTKNLYPLMKGDRRSLAQRFWRALTFAALCVVCLFLFFFMWAHRASPWHWGPLAGFAGGLVGASLGAHLQYAIVLYRNLYPRRYIKYLLPGALLYGAVYVTSWWKNTRGRVTWKGREYPAQVRSGTS